MSRSARARLGLVALGVIVGTPAARGFPLPPAPNAASPSDAPSAAAPAAGGAASKKQRSLAEKAAAPRATAPARAAAERALARRVGRPPEPVVNIVNGWTHETLPVATAVPAVLPPGTFDRFLRCHFTNQPAAMDARLLDVLIEAARQFRVRRIDIVSGFRAPKYNLMLRKKGREVARDSQHTKGHAVDFRIAGVPTARLRAWASRLRLGGVGYYEASRFVHVDVGPVRHWHGD